jgi:3-dehydroquinate synthase
VIAVERVRCRSRSYSVHVGPGAAAEIEARVAGCGEISSIVLVSDANVAPLHEGPVRERLEAAGRTVRTHVVPAGEAGKSRESLAALQDALAETGLGRDGLVLALGGGVVGDVAGFAAATWMRGVAHGIVATSLLAMVDASVGGKTAVNLPAAKNLVGAFHQPRFVVADTEHLATLPEEEGRSGLGEVVKAAMLGDPELFALLEARPHSLRVAEAGALTEVVRRCVRFKAGVVERDEREAGERARLNLGHTLGHALEAAGGYGDLRHGEAVAIGMTFVARIAARRGLLAPEEAARLEALLRALGLPTEIPAGASADELEACILRDKKVRGGEPVWVLPREIGRAELADLPGWRDELRAVTPSG